MWQQEIKNCGKIQGSIDKRFIYGTDHSAEPGSGTREILENELKRRGLQVSDFANLTEIGNIGVIQKMLQAGLGVTFFYQATIKGKEELQVIRLNDFKLRHDIMFIYRKNSIFEKDYRQIYEEFRENGKMDKEGKFQK